MPDAADALGVTVDAIRSRVKRETIDHVREGGRVYVLLGDDQDRPGHDQTTDRPDESDALTSQMQARIDSLEHQLQAERQAHAEARRIIARLVERVPAIEAPSDVRDDAETIEPEPEGASPRPGPTPSQESVQRRPWWRRVFGR